MLNRYISLTLALRYLNPLRTYFSIITLICLIGVSLGVMVLVVVLSVMGGLQKEIQGRLLAFSPHLQVSYHHDQGMLGTLGDWETLTEKLGKLPGIESSYAVVEDNSLVDAQGIRRPCFFRAIDTENREQIDGLQKLIRDGSFELDMGEKVVVSSQVADSMRIKVGTNLGILTLRNLNDITHAYREVEKELLPKRFPDKVRLLNELSSKATVNDMGETWGDKDIATSLATINDFIEQGRDAERNILYDLRDALENPTREIREPFGYLYPRGTAELWKKAMTTLAALDKDKEDLASLTQIKELVLPKDLEVIGIYQASQHVMSPDLFIPLNIGQELLGFDSGQVQSIALRVKDPYLLSKAVEEVRKALPPLRAPAFWQIETWQDRFSDWFSLMQRERSMMNFVLSFISLISAFCIMAVMFTVAIQRKKELAVIKALGATPGQIIRVFLWQGVIIGLTGALLGIALGVLVLHYRTSIHMFLAGIGFDPFPMDFHGVEIPAEINPSELIIEGVKAFIMVVIASVIPSIFTAYQDPAKSLRSL